MPTKSNKLVRDNIPEIIQQSGKKCEIKILSEAEYFQALLTKLVEEAQEAADASEDELTLELADIYEVIDAILEFKSIHRQTIIKKQQEKREEKGGFKKRIKLLSVEEKNQ